MKSQCVTIRCVVAWALRAWRIGGALALLPLRLPFGHAFGVIGPQARVYTVDGSAALQVQAEGAGGLSGKHRA